MIKTVMKDLPHGVGGFTLCDNEDNYTIFLNSRQTWEENRTTYRHEIHHIKKGDFTRGVCADRIERDL